MEYEFISGELFSKIADVSIYDRKYLDDFPNIKNNCNSIIYNNEPIDDSIIDKSSIFFVKTDHLDFFINCILPRIHKKFILITHNSDLPSGNKSVIYNNIHLLKWYGQNMIPNYHIDKLIGIPIGLENSQWKGSDYNICKKFKQNKKHHLLYFNFALNTNKERPYIDHVLTKNGFIRNNKTDWENYIKELSTYKFAVSPEGNGVDCHRVWECIYVGCIPILKHNNIMYDFFKELPILWINDFSDITELYLLEQYEQFENMKFNIEKSTIKYWYHDIHNTVI